MLRELSVQNLALIEDVRVELRDGFCAWTGETGAGKSLLLGALGLLIGERGSVDLIRTGCDELRVTGLIELNLPDLSAAWRKSWSRSWRRTTSSSPDDSNARAGARPTSTTHRFQSPCSASSASCLSMSTASGRVIRYWSLRIRSSSWTRSASSGISGGPTTRRRSTPGSYDGSVPSWSPTRKPGSGS